MIPDSITACPAGDSVTFAHSPLHPHPSRLRILIAYTDNDCNPKVDVSPESIYIKVLSTTGNAKINDKTLLSVTFADDPTDATGHTRIIVPSLSGCGTITLRLFVSGVSQGTKTVRVRTTDYNADGRIGNGDLGTGQQCDLNWDGVANFTDFTIVSPFHVDHWKRNALHGGMVRRTTRVLRILRRARCSTLAPTVILRPLSPTGPSRSPPCPWTFMTTTQAGRH